MRCALKPTSTLARIASTSGWSAVGQNRLLAVEIKGFKTSRFLEYKTAPLDCPDAGPMGHVERPESESASGCLGECHSLRSGLNAPPVTMQ
jgi:hypothetical protein